jgi:hypothetical protein
MQIMSSKVPVLFKDGENEHQGGGLSTLVFGEGEKKFTVPVLQWRGF